MAFQSFTSGLSHPGFVADQGSQLRSNGGARDQHADRTVTTLDHPHRRDRGHGVDRAVASVPQVRRRLPAALRKGDLPVQIRDFGGEPVELLQRGLEPEARGPLDLVQPLRDVAERERDLVSMLLHQAAQAAVGGMIGQVRPGRPERVERGGEPRIGEVAEDLLYLTH